MIELPADFEIEVKERTEGVSKGSKDKYFYPNGKTGKLKLRSLPEVAKYLAKQRAARIATEKDAGS